MPDLFSDEVLDIANEADLFVLNLECAISDRGERWPDPDKPYFFRAPPIATQALGQLGVDCVTLANNHALDYGATALLDTIDHLDRAGIGWVGAGPNEASARAPITLHHDGTTLGIVAVTDHPRAFAARPDRPGVAFADLWQERPPQWLRDAIAGLDTDIVLVSPHWGPNMISSPLPHVRTAATDFLAAGATLVAGHSAHVFHGVAGCVLFDLGDFIDDYATNPTLHNDLGLMFFVEFEGATPVTIDAIPLALDFCHTRLATGAEHRWIADRFERACAEFGTTVQRRGDRLRIDLVAPAPSDQSSRQVR